MRDTLRLFASLYPNPLPRELLIDLCALGEFIDRDSRKLSGGQRQRLLLALALLGDPELLFLDEPTTGLDPQARHHFWQRIEAIKAQGKTVVLTTHYMDEAQQLCDLIAIVDHGRRLPCWRNTSTACWCALGGTRPWLGSAIPCVRSAIRWSSVAPTWRPCCQPCWILVCRSPACRCAPPIWRISS